jgi:polyribonucleotide nucleotidyltransferase
LLHISKIGGGKRIDRVEDVLNLGDEVTVRVDDIDNSGKLSLSMAGADAPPAGDDEPRASNEGPRERSRDRSSDRGSDRGGERGESRSRERERGGGDRERGNGEVASFEDRWEAQAKEQFGDLGPADTGRGGSGSGGPGGGGGDRGRGRGGRSRGRR